MTDTILCIDIGTTSLKAALIPDNYKEVFVSRQVFKNPQSDTVADEWLPALKNALSELHEKNPDYAIEAICVSGNGPTLVTENSGVRIFSAEQRAENGVAMSALPHSRHSPQSKALLTNAFGGATSANAQSFTLSWNKKLEIPAIQTHSIFIPRLVALKNNFPEVWNSSETVFSGPEYLLYKLTGKKLTILPEKRFEAAYWNDEELEKQGFSAEEKSKLPPFVKMGGFAGTVTGIAAEYTGLFEGTFVFAGAPDFVVALLGTGTVFPGTMCDRAGSSEGINLCTSTPVFGENLRTLPSSIPELWNVSKLKGKSDSNPDEKTQFSETVSFFSDAITELRAAAESAGEYFPKSLTITGGQAHNDELTQAKATAANISIKVPVCIDAELIGDLILTRVALGDYDDIEEAVMCLCKNQKTFLPENNQ